MEPQLNDIFTNPKPNLSDDALQLILGNLVVADSGWDTARQQDRLWLRVSDDLRDQVCLLAGLDRQELQRNSVCPTFSVYLYPELKKAIGECMIYSQVDSRSYYLELFKIDNGDEYRLCAKYQQILGWRLMATPSKSMVTAICVALAAQLMEQAAKPSKTTKEAQVLAAASKGLTEQQEVDLLTHAGDRIVLPQQKLKHYAKIKVRIEKAGGRYHTGGYFDFPPGIDAAHVLSQMQDGKTIHPKKDAQFFRTPAQLAHQVCAAVGPLAGKRVLEPSAGDGALADLVRAAGADLVLVENWNVNVLKLKAAGYEVMDRDFLTVTPEEIGLFDAIVANPPFTRGLDMIHVERMLRFLKPGGTLSVLTSTSWVDGSQRKQAEFRALLERHGARLERIEPGAFKASGTGVGVMHVVLTLEAVDQPAEVEELAEAA